MAAAAASSSGSPYRSRFGDTTLTKVFVGGLAWETPSEGLRQHFEQYGDILEAVVITDRLTGRSKGYGFVSLSSPITTILLINPLISLLSFLPRFRRLTHARHAFPLISSWAL